MANKIGQVAIVACVALAASAALGAAAGNVAWQIGTKDGTGNEFALAPRWHREFVERGFGGEDKFFLVGWSNPETDFPYVLPGPLDKWARYGSSPQLGVLFDVKETGSEVGWTLVVDFSDANYIKPPLVEIAVNGNAREERLPRGGNDGSIDYGDFSKASPHRFRVELKAGEIKPGVNKITFRVKDGSWALFDCLRLEAPDGAVLDKGSGSVLAKKAAERRSPDWPNLEEVIIVTKCHLDVGYTHTVPELIERYRTVYMDRALALFDSDRAKPSDLRVRWTMPAWLIDAILKGHYAPERRAKIEDAVRQRRLMWHALPFTSEPEASDVEELVRMFSYGSNLSRKFGFDLPRYAKQTDVPEYAWVMPTLLAHAGVKFLQMGINPCSKSKAEVAKIPPLCWWEGPDGSRILLGFSPQYGWWGQGSVTPPKGWRHKTWLAYYMKGDNAGPMSRKEVDNILRQAREMLPGVKVRFGDPAEFADAIIAEEKAHPSLPIVRGDMPDTWIHGMMSLPETTAIHRRTIGDLVTLGQLDTTLRAFGVATEPVADLLDRAYRDSGLYSEHTWGMRGHRVRGPKLFQPDWRKRYEAGEYKEFDATFQYHADYARRAYKAVQEGIRERMEALARSVAVDDLRVVVFNPLPYVRDSVVEVEMPEGYSVPDGERDGGKVRFLAKGLPAGGYKTFAVKKLEKLERLENLDVLDGQPKKLRHFTVKFDLEKGGIASLVENATGRELVKQGEHALGQFLHERFSRNEVARYSKVYNERQRNDGLSKPGMPDVAHSPYAAITPSSWRARMKRSPLGVEVVMTPDDTKGLAKAYEMRFSFPDHLPCVDITWRVEDKTLDPIPEGGWLCLPFNVEGPSFCVGRIGGTIDPAKDIIFGANKDILCADRAITVRSGPGGAGVGVASADLPLWSLGRPGLWRYEPDYVPTEPEVFANLYNNQWNTNYPLWIPGSWSASLRVYPVAHGADEEQTIFTPAWEIRQPAVAAFAAGKTTSVQQQGGRTGKTTSVQQQEGYTLPAVANGIALSRKGVRVTAFCPNPDGAGTVLRVWEQAGKGGDIMVTLPPGMKATTAQPVNLRGEVEGSPIPVKDGKFSFELNAWAPRSFTLGG